MLVLDEMAKSADRAIDFLIDIFNINIDTIASIACIIASACCVYLLAAILKERTPLVYLQRWALGGLAVALFANSVTYYPEWATIQGHRPTGAIVDVMVMVLVVVMAIRGNMVYQPGRHRAADENDGRRMAS